MFDFSDDEVIIMGGSGPIGQALLKILPGAYAPTHDYCDLLYDIEKFRNIIINREPKVVFNLIGKTTNMVGNIKYAAQIFHENTIMHMNLLGVCAIVGKAKVVSVLPSCAYPDIDICTIREEMFWKGKSEDNIESHGMARRNTLMYARQLNKQYNFNHISVVLNNIIGEGDSVDPDKTKFAMGVIVRMVEAKRTNSPTFTVWGTGAPKRSLLYAGDAAEGLIRAAQLYDDCMEPLNITNNNEITIADYVSIVKDKIGYEGEIVFDSSKPDGQMRKMLNGEKMWNILKWTPPTSIETAVEKVVDWYQENY